MVCVNAWLNYHATLYRTLPFFFHSMTYHIAKFINEIILLVNVKFTSYKIVFLKGFQILNINGKSFRIKNECNKKKRGDRRWADKKMENINNHQTTKIDAIYFCTIWGNNISMSCVNVKKTFILRRSLGLIFRDSYTIITINKIFLLYY